MAEWTLAAAAVWPSAPASAESCANSSLAALTWSSLGSRRGGDTGNSWVTMESMRRASVAEGRHSSRGLESTQPGCGTSGRFDLRQHLPYRRDVLVQLPVLVHVRHARTDHFMGRPGSHPGPQGLAQIQRLRRHQ